METARCFLKIQFRPLTSSSVYLKAKAVTQQYTILTKLLKSNSKKKTSNIPKPLPVFSATSTSTVTATEPSNSILPSSAAIRFNNFVPARESRRQSVLNALFMENITAILASQQIAKELQGLAIEITGVKVTRDFSIVNVYWFNGSDYLEEENIQRVLDANTNRLRSILIGLHVLGNVPKIRFVRDKTQSTSSRVFKLLGSEIQREDELLDIRNRIPVIQKTMKSEESTTRTDDPNEMSHGITKESQRSREETVRKDDIFGLDHFVMMKKVKEQCSKAKAKHRLSSSSSPPHVDASQDDLKLQLQASSTTASNKEQFKQFLRDRKRTSKIRNNSKTSNTNDNRHFLLDNANQEIIVIKNEEKEEDDFFDDDLATKDFRSDQ